MGRTLELSNGEDLRLAIFLYHHLQCFRGEGRGSEDGQHKEEVTGETAYSTGLTMKGVEVAEGSLIQNIPMRCFLLQ